MQPPKTLDLTQPKNPAHIAGFTILLFESGHEKVLNADGTFKEWRKTRIHKRDIPNLPAKEVNSRANSLWRSIYVLTHNERTRHNATSATLVSFDETSFYQNNNDVTVALYFVKGYAYTVIVWFDNETGERIA